MTYLIFADCNIWILRVFRKSSTNNSRRLLCFVTLSSVHLVNVTERLSMTREANRITHRVTLKGSRAKKKESTTLKYSTVV